MKSLAEEIAGITSDSKFTRVDLARYYAENSYSQGNAMVYVFRDGSALECSFTGEVRTLTH